MGKQKIKKPHETKSVIKDYNGQAASVKRLENDECFVISFKHLDKNQGQTFFDWQEDKMLGMAIDTLAGYCHKPLNQQFSSSFTVYGNFPQRSAFKHPVHVPQDVKWARIHVNGTHILAGHVFKNIFYVVFFDNNHTFYITEKKHT